jgi:hypothetical protein
VILKVVKVNSELVNRDGLSLCQVNRKKRLQTARGEGIFFSFPYTPFLSAFKK